MVNEKFWIIFEEFSDKTQIFHQQGVKTSRKSDRFRVKFIYKIFEVSFIILISKFRAFTLKSFNNNKRRLQDVFVELITTFNVGISAHGFKQGSDDKWAINTWNIANLHSGCKNLGWTLLKSFVSGNFVHNGNVSQLWWKDALYHPRFSCCSLLQLRHWNQKFHTKKEWTLTFERLFHDFFVIKLSICMHFANFHGGFNNPNFPRKYFHPIWIICGPYLGFLERLYKYVLIILNFTFGDPVFWCFWSN